jgi:membrane protease YdiL (CAAX protease family)
MATLAPPHPTTATATAAAAPRPERVTIPQYSRRGVLAVWAAAALPMAALSWIVAPILADRLGGPQPLMRALLLSLTAGLIWQFVLVVTLVAREQRTLRWSTVRQALWLRRPESPDGTRTGGRLWLVLLPMAVIVAAVQVLPHLPIPGDRDMNAIMSSTTGQEMFEGAWGWFAVVVTMAVFNTVLGEELFFRGFLLPRMNGAFGRGDWIVNGLLFAAYHMHVPWGIAKQIGEVVAYYPCRRYRSAVLGIIIHSVQSVLITIAVLALVLG